MTEIETAWLAGLLEGEGCFRSTGNCPHICLQMTDQDVVERAAHLLKVKVTKREGERANWKPVWRIHVCGDDAVLLMNNLLPLMGERRGAKIKYLIEKVKRRLTLSESARKSHQARRLNLRDKHTMEMF